MRGGSRFFERGHLIHACRACGPKLHVFGDSHAVACFDRFTDADVYWLGPMTMHRVGRDGADFIERYAPSSSPRDIFVFVFGEIDVRCHIWRIAALRATRVEFVVSTLANQFLESVEVATKNRNGRVVICSVVPPSELSEDPDYPTYGWIEDRVATTWQLNADLREGANRRGMIFLDFAETFADKRGRLRPTLSDGSVHIGLDHTRPICRALAAAVGEPIRYRQDLWWRGKLWAPIRLVLAWLRPQALWRFNRGFVSVKTMPWDSGTG
jgi:hypothetical protein